MGRGYEGDEVESRRQEMSAEKAQKTDELELTLDWLGGNGFVLQEVSMQTTVQRELN